MAISAALVKQLRERTGAGMMECKKALVETDGDLEAAVEHMRKTGLAKADKKAGRTAAEGLVVIKKSDDGKQAVMVEVNCETDFVTKGDDFKDFADAVATTALQARPADVDALLETPLAGGDASVGDSCKELIAKIGENMSVRRFVLMESEGGALGDYLHGSRIGVMVALEGGDTELARDLAMHVAASRPQYISHEDVPAEDMEKEREILIAQSQESGKPQEIIEKMVEGRLKKHLKEITLLGQPFVKDPDTEVEKLLKDARARVTRFERFEVGEGKEKKQENFAE
ncbi:MAG TPA: translation elongation factor Ts, partial [Gammaproteobacteria bacterium]|nr:translation elongation factor Ts [Gammaproteobacteria bacterium]